MTDHERGEFRFDWQKEPEGVRDKFAAIGIELPESY